MSYKDQIIGIRFSEEERILIERFARDESKTLTKFIRDTIFSYINQSKNNVKIINHSEISSILNNSDKAIVEILENINLLKKRFQV